MFQETSPTATQEYFKAYVGVDTLSVLVTANLGKPDITTSNTFEDCISDSRDSHIPHHR